MFYREGNCAVAEVDNSQKYLKKILLLPKLYQSLTFKIILSQITLLKLVYHIDFKDLFKIKSQIHEKSGRAISPRHTTRSKKNRGNIVRIIEKQFFNSFRLQIIVHAIYLHKKVSFKSTLKGSQAN